LHLLEGPSFSVLKILKHLAGHSHFVDVANPIQTGRIIYSVEDHPKRHFPEWYSITIQERKSQADEVTDENCKDIVTDLATRLLEIGKSLQFESQEDISRFFCLFYLDILKQQLISITGMPISCQGKV
jgi:hypothetical protein